MQKPKKYAIMESQRRTDQWEHNTPTSKKKLVMNHRGNDKESQSDNVKLKHGGVALYIDFLSIYK